MATRKVNSEECYKGDTQNSHSRTINQKPENRGQRRNHHGGHQAYRTRHSQSAYPQTYHSKEYQQEGGRRSHQRHSSEAHYKRDTRTTQSQTDRGKMYENERGHGHHRYSNKENFNEDNRTKYSQTFHKDSYDSEKVWRHQKYFDRAYYNEETKTKITPVSSERSFDNDRERRSHHGQSQKARYNTDAETLHQRRIYDEKAHDKERGDRRHHRKKASNNGYTQNSNPHTHKEKSFDAEWICDGLKELDLSKNIKYFQPEGNVSKEEDNFHSKRHGRQESFLLDEIVKLDNNHVDHKAQEYLQRQQSESRLQKKDVSETCRYLNNLVDSFLCKLNELTPGLKWKNLNSGSYYEKTKTSKPDEFDVMIYPSRVSVAVDFSDKSVPGFYKVKMISTRVSEIKDSIDGNGYVIPGEFKTIAFDLFDKAIRHIKEGRRIRRKENSSSSPTYSIDFDPGAGITHLDIDLVPCFKIEGWPEVARRINPQWIQADSIVNDSMKSFDVVCKACPQDHKDKELLWRLSFAKTEKILMTYANSTDEYKFKKNAYKCLKLCIEKVKAVNAGRVFKWSSYNLKHFMFHQYDNWPNECSDEVVIQRNLIKQLIDHLNQTQPEITHYIIENYNIICHIQKEEICLIVDGLKEELKKLSKSSS